MLEKPEPHGFELIGHVPIFCSDIVIRGSYAYLANGWDGFSIFDISDISSPFLVGKLPSSNYARSLTCYEDIVYIAEYPDEESTEPFSRPAGVRFIDVSNPAAPIEINHYPASDFVDAAVMHNDHLFILVNHFPEPFTCTLLVLSPQDDRSPILIGKCSLSGRGYQLVLSNHHAYIATFDGLHVIDISHLESPRETYHIGNHLSLQAIGIDDDSQNLYVASYFQGLRIFSKQTEAPPIAISRTLLWGPADSVAVHGNTAYVSDIFYGLWRLDLTDLKKPRESGFFPLEHTGSRRLAVAHSHVFITAEHTGLFILRDTPGRLDLNIHHSPWHTVLFDD